MSKVEYVKCDGNAEFTHHPSTPRRPDEKKPPKLRGYARKWQEARANAVSKRETYDLCPDCAKKAMEAVGLE